MWAASKGPARHQAMDMQAFVHEFSSFRRALWVANKTPARQKLLAMQAFAWEFFSFSDGRGLPRRSPHDTGRWTCKPPCRNFYRSVAVVGCQQHTRTTQGDGHAGFRTEIHIVAATVVDCQEGPHTTQGDGHAGFHTGILIVSAIAVGCLWSSVAMPTVRTDLAHRV